MNIIKPFSKENWRLLKLVKCTLLLLVLFSSENLFSQDYSMTQVEFDSIMATPEEFHTAPKEYYRNPKKYGVDPSKIKSILESNPTIKGWHFYYARMAHFNYIEGGKDSTLYYIKKFNEAYAALEKKSDSDNEQLMLAYFLNGRFETRSRAYSKSLNMHLKASQLAEKKMHGWFAMNNYCIGRNLYNLGNDSIALVYLNKALTDSIYTSRPGAVISTNNLIGDIYKKFGELELAKASFVTNLEIATKNNLNANLMAIYIIMADISQLQKNEDSVRHYYKKAIQVFEQYPEANSQTPQRVMYHKLFNAYFKIHDGDIDSGIDDLTEILRVNDTAKKVHRSDKKLVLWATNFLGEAYTKKGNSQKYSELLDFTSNYLDKFHSQQLKEDLANLEIHYQTQEKDNSIIQLEKNKKQQEGLILQQRIISIALAGLLLLLAGLGFLFWRQRKLKNQYITANLEQRLLRSQLSPHFIFNAMVSAGVLAKEKSDKTVPYIAKFSNLLRLILKNSRQEFVTLSEEMTAVENYLELQSDFSQKFAYNISVSEGIDKESIQIPPMFIQPFIENSIQHGLQGKLSDLIELTVSLDQKKRLIHFSIIDNGIGYTKGLSSKRKKIGESVSNKILRDRLKIYAKLFKVNARYNVSDLDGESGGTQVDIFLPYIID